MTDYRLLADYTQGGTFADATGRTCGLEFVATAPCWITTLWFWRPSTSVTLPTSAALWRVADGGEVPGTPVTISGVPTETTGWIPVALPAPVALPVGTYRAGVHYPAGTLPGQGNWWLTTQSTDIVSGPVTAPTSANATGNAQGPYQQGTARAYPNTTNASKANYGVDVTVTDTGVYWAADLGAGSTATSNVAAGYADNSSQRQNGAGEFNDTSTPWPLPVQAAPGGRAGRAVKVVVPANYTRVEQTFPAAHGTFAEGAEAWFGNAFYLDAGFPIAATAFQVIEQVRHGAGVSTGSPPLSFDVHHGALYASGGWGKPGASPATQFSWERVLVPSLQRQRWYHLVYFMRFSTVAANTRLDVWVDGIPVVVDFQIPGANVYSGAGDSMRKQGLYHDPSIPGGTVWHAGAALGSSYAAVDPSQGVPRRRPARMLI